MGELRKYTVKVNGFDTVLNLSEEDAKLYPDAKPAGEEPAADERAAKTRVAPNKARAAEHK